MARNQAIDYQTLYSLVDSRTTQIMGKFEALEGRVSTLEKWQSNLTGRISIIVAVVVTAAGFTGDWIKKQIGI